MSRRQPARTRHLLSAVAIASSLLLALLWVPPGHAKPKKKTGGASNVTIVAAGLDNPRGLAFDARGALYVAEAGRGGNGPCILTSAGVDECLGSTGAITRVWRGKQVRLVDGLPSIAAPELDGGNAIGPSDITFQGSRAYVTIGLAAEPTLRDDLGSGGAAMGRLFGMTPQGKMRELADVAPFELATNPDGDVVDTNPHAVIFSRGARIIADAGGNSLLRAASSGHITTLAVFPTGLAEAPPFLGLPPGTRIPYHSVPTSVVEGPDGAYYVGELTGFPFPVGGAKIWRVPRGGGDPEVFSTGFTHIIDLAFGKDGSLYVLQIATDSLFIAPPSPGALIRVAPNGTRTMLAQEELSFPTGLAIGPDGDLYVSNNGGSPGIGEVVRIPAP